MSKTKHWDLDSLFRLIPRAVNGEGEIRALMSSFSRTLTSRKSSFRFTGSPRRPRTGEIHARLNIWAWARRQRFWQELEWPKGRRRDSQLKRSHHPAAESSPHPLLYLGSCAKKLRLTGHLTSASLDTAEDTQPPDTRHLVP